MIAIDADSHFTREVTLVDSPPQLAPQIEQLIERNHLCFGHWEIGDQHDTFVILLRALADNEIDWIYTKVKAASDAWFGNATPDFVIFPGESTAIHLATRFAIGLGAARGVVVASPAFRAYGKHVLRLEMSSEHMATLRDKKQVNVLFFDDSLSSGDTEMHALDAFLRQKRLLQITPQIHWVTFSVLWRAQRLAPDRPARKREAPRIPHGEALRYNFDSFGVIGPESLSRSECPLCRASQRIHNAVAWARGARPAVRHELEAIDDLLQPRSIERWAFRTYSTTARSRNPLSPLDVVITKMVLRLEAMRMTEACIYIWSQFVQPNSRPVSVEEKLAVLLYCGLHHIDIGSYLSSDASIALIRTTARSLDLDASAQREAFLIALSAFPAGTLETVAPELALEFAGRGNVDLAAALLAMAFSAQHSTLLECSTLQGMERRQRVLVRQSHRSSHCLKERCRM